MVLNKRECWNKQGVRKLQILIGGVIISGRVGKRLEGFTRNLQTVPQQ